MQLKPETTLQGGKYRIVKTLGQGGFGITYLAEQVALHRRVAIKEFFMKEYCERDVSTSLVTLGATAGSKDLVARFREKFIKEALMIAQLDHPNIVKIHDVFEENGTAYYAMEFIIGGSLKELIAAQGPLDEPTALKYMHDVGDALQYVHKKKILHFDIKPSNIMLRESGTAALIDFGVSKHNDDGGHVTSSTPVGISKGYAPLEQYRQEEIGTFTPATDIYAFGATLFSLVTGQNPPDAHDVYENDGVDFPLHTSADMKRLILTLMKPRKRDRPQAMEIVLPMLNLKAAPEKPKEIVPPSDDENTVIFKEGPVHLNPESIQHEVFSANEVSFEMIRIKGGTFTMGASEDQPFSERDEYPAHQVTLDSFSLGETPVTQELWFAVMGKNPSKNYGVDCPVEKVSWEDCQLFINKLNTLTGKTFRLPTEAEWEYAAKGGIAQSTDSFAGGQNAGDVAWFSKNSEKRPHPVKEKKCNSLGLYDMSGNVWEWCKDLYETYQPDAQENPQGASFGTQRVIRGGSFTDDEQCCRTSFRNAAGQYYRSKDIGLRLAL